MLEEEVLVRFAHDPKGLAEFYGNRYYGGEGWVFPVNPFEILSRNGVHFVFRHFDGMEGLYFPANDGNDVDLVAINVDRPITRQRYTAAHELCHFLKDRNSVEGNITCVSKSDAPIERYAERFACALLMPRKEVLCKVGQVGSGYGLLSLDDILRISSYFGVSFEACYYRVKELAPRRTPVWNKAAYRPFKRMQWLGLGYDTLKLDLIDEWDDVRNGYASPFALQVFRNKYVYNDSRIEGIQVTHEMAAEIVTDLVNNTQHSKYCDERNDVFCNIAGHACMYDLVFKMAASDAQITIWKLMDLNKALFSCVPYPEYGGVVRTANPYVMGAKFETSDNSEVFIELLKLNEEVVFLENNWKHMKKREIILRIARIHHRITRIHPFGDGNGRTSRAFANLTLIRYDLVPFYVGVREKNKYIRALEIADQTGEYGTPCSFIVDGLIRSHVEFAR